MLAANTRPAIIDERTETHRTNACNNIVGKQPITDPPVHEELR
jgi:hypothetical protein